jgi:hypothetical protein
MVRILVALCRGTPVEWVEPWWHVVEEKPDLAAAYEKELQAELGIEHPLFAMPVEAVGKRDGSDDVLFRLLDGSDRVAVVHLTWARHPEPWPWPLTDVFPDMAAFVACRLQPDHEEFRE